MTASRSMLGGLRTFISDVANGLFEITHSGFAMLGLAVVFAALTLTVQPQIREQGELLLMEWLQARQEPAGPNDNDIAPTDRATASDPSDLPKQQAKVAYWLSKKYRVAPEPISALVAEAYHVGMRSKLDPTLILAVMAIESGFNPFAQSPVGAQGLMQVMTKVHTDKYEPAGGNLAAFDPVTNLRVGVKVLKECIARAGSIEGGLRYYVGAANLDNDGGYAQKVLAEYARIRSVATGTPVMAPGSPQVVPAAAPVPGTDDGYQKVVAFFTP
jgi:Transglycosylase SLT domain